MLFDLAGIVMDSDRKPNVAVNSVMMANVSLTPIGSHCSKRSAALSGSDNLAASCVPPLPKSELFPCSPSSAGSRSSG